MSKPSLMGLWAGSRRDPVLLTLLVMAAAYFVLYYLTDPTRPGEIYHLGWFGYYDQGQYLREAHSLANLSFQQLHKTFTYGRGYPLVAVPFIWLGFDKEPFVFFNLVAFVFATYAVYKVAKRLISPFAGFLASFGLVFAARYVDIIWLGVIALAALYRGSIKNLSKYAVFMLIGVLIFMASVMYAQDRIFESPFRTTYVNHIGLGGSGGSDQGLAAYNVHRIPKAVVAFFLSPIWAGSKINDGDLIMNMFWALAAIPVVILLFRRKNNRLFFSCFVTAGLVALLFYLSFRASESNSPQYGELHYFKMWWPGVVILATAFFDYLMRISIKSLPPRSKNRLYNGTIHLPGNVI